MEANTFILAVLADLVARAIPRAIRAVYVLQETLWALLWSKRIVLELYLPVVGAGALAHFVLDHTTVAVPSGVEAWAIASAIALAITGPWVITRSLLQSNQPQ